jgi:hypothetical protein
MNKYLSLIEEGRESDLGSWRNERDLEDSDPLRFQSDLIETLILWQIRLDDKAVVSALPLDLVAGHLGVELVACEGRLCDDYLRSSRTWVGKLVQTLSKLIYFNVGRCWVGSKVKFVSVVCES